MRKAFTLVLLALAIMIVAVSCDDPKHEHSYDANVWEKDGTSHWHVCTTCGEKVEVAEHTLETIEAKEPTCTEKGWDTYVKCSVCGYSTYKEKAALGHTTVDGQCSRCKDYFYSSVENMNTNAKRADILNKTVTVTVGKQNFKENTYTENSSGLGTNVKSFFIGNTDLNKYNAKPLGDAESEKDAKVTFVFKDGEITTSSTGYKSIDDHSDDQVYMLVPGKSDVVFENITFNGVVSFGIQIYTSDWSYLNSITFKNCTFNGIVVGTAPAYNVTFDSCTFTKYDNTENAKGSNPVYMRPSVGDWREVTLASENRISMHSFTFVNNKVCGSLPVKLENVGIYYEGKAQVVTPVITVFDNYFDISEEYTSAKHDDNRKMGFMIRPYKNGAVFTLFDDGNTKSEGTTAVYAIDDDQTDFFSTSGIKILDRDGNNKEIKALVFKSEDTWVTLKTIE